MTGKEVVEEWLATNQHPNGIRPGLEAVIDAALARAVEEERARLLAALHATAPPCD